MRVGLIVMRGQPLHYGHIRVIDEALKLCDMVIIILGSTQEHGTSRNPFTYGERKKMIKTYYMSTANWKKINIIGLEDIFSLQWPNYVLDSIKKEMPNVNITDIFGGSEYDCAWFKDFDFEKHVLNRSDTEYPFVSASMIRDMLMYKDKRWMQYVPNCNWYFVAKKFNRLDMLVVI